MSAARARRGAWALVPVKLPTRAKTRLAPVLAADERAALQRAMFADVLAALSRARRLAGVAVISPDVGLARIAGRFGATFIVEPPPADDLNRAVGAGAEWLRRAGAATIAVIPADVPLLDPADVDVAVRRAEETGATLIVPDRCRQGTNALVFDAAARPDFAYGPGSFSRHLLATAGRPARLLALASLARDIDTQADLVGLVRRCAQAGALATGGVIAAIEQRQAAVECEEVP